MEDNYREVLINYRLNQASEAILEVGKLIEAGLLNVAVTRIYYGIFYCLTALALKEGFQSSKHLQLIGWFNQSFIKPGKVEIKYGKILRDAYKNRNEGDYLPFIKFSADEVEALYLDMKDFIDTISMIARQNS